MNMKIVDILKNNVFYVALIFLGIVFLSFSGISENTTDTNDFEESFKRTLEMVEGVGEVDVMVTYDNNKMPEGAIVVADGARNVNVKKMLHDSAVAVLNLPDYKVQVMTKRK